MKDWPTLADVGATLKRYWIVVAFVLIVVIAVIAYLVGYRISTGFTVVRVGTLELTHLPTGAQVYVDEGSRGTATTGTMSFPLIPGTHTVIVSLATANPWETYATVKTGQTVAIDPILIPLRPTVAPLSATDTVAALKAVATEKIPTASNPLILGCVSIAANINNQIVASVASSTPGCAPAEFMCTNGNCAPTIVFAPVSPMQDIVAYPGRTDALLVNAGNTVYAIGLDPRTPQAFAQLLAAPGVRIATLPSGATVVENASGIYSLSI